MDNIKIVRFKTGEDVISMVEEVDDYKIKLIKPMFFDVGKGSTKNYLSMGFWLPAGVIETNEVVLDSMDILFMIDANMMFSEYYNTLIIEDLYKDNVVDTGENSDLENSMHDVMKDLLSAKDNGSVH